jgi:hypothetical protein
VILFVFFLLGAVSLFYRDIFGVAKDRRFLTCRGEVSDYICSCEVLNWIWNYSIIVSNSVLYLVLVVFLLGGEECYLVIVDFDSFSVRTCIPILLDEQRHLVGRF